MRLDSWLLRMSGRRLVPLLMFVFALVVIGLRYQHQMGTIDLEVSAQERERLRERLNIDQARLALQLGAQDRIVVRRLVSALALHDGVEQAYLVDRQGLVVASLARLHLGRALDEVLLGWPNLPAREQLQRLPAEPLAIELLTEPVAAGVAAVVPLPDGYRLRVWLDLTRPLALRRAVVQQEVVREAIAVLVAVAALALMLHLMWFRRARRLARSLAAMGAGDFSVRSGLLGRDELAHIGAEADRMAQQLARDQQHLRHMNELINRTSAVVIEWANQPGWPVLQVSDAVRQWGYEPGQLLRGELHFNALFHPDDEPRVNAEVARYFEHGPDQYQQEYRIRRADGGWAWVDDRTSLTRNAAGEVVSISGVLLDMSAQKEAEQAKREQAEQLRMFYELPFLGMAVSSPVTKRWLQVNDRLCQILGYSRAELLTMSWADMTPPGDLERNVELFDELVAGRRDGYRLNKRFLHKGGSIVHADIDVRALRNPDGSIRQLFATIQDVTERKAAEVDLRRLGAMADNASDALLLTVAGRYEDCNPAAVRLFGFDSRADLVGRSPTETSPVLQPDGRPSDEAAWGYLQAAMQGVQQRFEWQHRRKDGSVFDAEVGLVRFQMDDGRPAVIGIVRDISERKAADTALRRSQELLLKSQQIGRMGSWTQDLVNGQFTWSPQTYAIHEVDPQVGALDLSQILALLHPDDVSRVDRIYADCMRSGAPYDIRYRLRMVDGRIKHLHVKGEFEFEAGVPVRSVGMVADETELVEAQSERDRLVSVMETSADIVSMADPQGRVFYFNRAGYEMLGLRPGEPLDDVIRQVHPDWAAQRVREEGIPAAIAQGRWLGESAVLDPQGHEVPMSQLIMAHRDSDGEVDYLWTILRDISERKAAEAALHLERERLDEAQTVARIGSWSVNAVTGDVQWSDHHYEVLGLDPARVQPSIDAYLSTVHPDDRSRVTAHVAGTGSFEGHRERKIEHRIVTPAGVRHVEERARVERDAQGRLLRIFGTTMDITERVLAEQALRQAKGMLEQAESVAQLGSFAYDSETGAMSWSRQAFATIGLPWSDAPPSIDAYCDCIHPDDVAMVRRSIACLLAGQDVPEVRYRTAPGRGPVRWLRRVYQRIDRTHLGLKPRYIGTLQDITEAVQAEEKLRAVNQMLEERVAERTAQLSQANQELEAFSYSVSHDLKAPLRGIDGYSQLLVEEYGPLLDEQGRDFVGRIRHGVQLMGTLISDLLEYSRMERRGMSRDPVALQPLVQQVLAVYEADIRNGGVQVQMDLQPFTLSLDREGIAVVLRNLVGNALKFSRNSQPPRLEIGSRQQDGRRILWVRDNGVGFDMKYHDRVFGIFQRLHRAEDFPGTGVGLALVSKAVQRMGGRVWAESAPGEGATFYLEFPE